MPLLECIRLALESIKVNKMRSVLTMLGIIIGISAVITITTIGNSVQKTLSSTMSDIGGTNVINGYLEANMPEDPEAQVDYVYPEMTENDYITYDMIKAYKDAFKGKVDVAIATVELGQATTKNGKYTVNTNVTGSTEGYTKSMDLDIIAGRDISESDYKDCRPTAVVSDLFVKYALKSDEDVIGQKVTLTLGEGGTAFKVYIVGVYKYDARIFGTVGQQTEQKDISTNLIIPASYAQKLNGSTTKGFENLNIIVSNGQDASQISTETVDYFNQTDYANNEDWQFACYDSASEIKTINKVLLIVTIAISAIAGISLIVGGVGVMNIMLVSVTERTHEIGIRKALGAENRTIHMQFLIEAVVICLIGGLIGITIGIINGFILSKVAASLVTAFASDMASYLTVTVRPSVLAIVISVVFSMLTGIVFGSYPAKRASKLSPIDALRYE